MNIKFAIVLTTAALTGCATWFDKPWITTQRASNGQDGLYAWSSGSAAAVGMQSTDGSPYFCVLGAAFARTGSTSSGVSLTTIGVKSQEATTSGTAGALLLKNEGQTATYLDTGLFHLCMMYAQNLISEQTDRTALVKSLMTSSVEVVKASQFATVASLQPDNPGGQTAGAAAVQAAASAAAQSASAAAKSATAADSSAKAAATSASAAASAASSVKPKPAAPAPAASAAQPAASATLSGKINSPTFPILGNPESANSGRSSQKQERNRVSNATRPASAAQ